MCDINVFVINYNLQAYIKNRNRFCHLPYIITYFGANMIASLADLQVKYFSHFAVFLLLNF